MKNVKTYPGADCNSDHQLLVAKCKVRLKKLHKPPPPLRFDTTLIDNEYTVAVENKFEELLKCEDYNPNEAWETGKNVILETAKEKVPKGKRTWHSWISSETLEEIAKEEESKQVTSQARRQGGVQRAEYNSTENDVERQTAGT